jgi:hypothetical protein
MTQKRLFDLVAFRRAMIVRPTALRIDLAARGDLAQHPRHPREVSKITVHRNKIQLHKDLRLDGSCSSREQDPWNGQAPRHRLGDEQTTLPIAEVPTAQALTD